MGNVTLNTKGDGNGKRQVRLHTYELVHCYRQGADLVGSLSRLGPDAKIVVMGEVLPSREVEQVIGPDCKDLAREWKDDPIDGILTYLCAKDMLSELERFGRGRDCRFVYVDDKDVLEAQSAMEDVVHLERMTEGTAVACIAIQFYIQTAMSERRSRVMLERVRATVEVEPDGTHFVIAAGKHHIDEIKEMLKSDLKAGRKNGADRAYELIATRIEQPSYARFIEETVAFLPKEVDDRSRESIRKDLLEMLRYPESSVGKGLYVRLKSVLPVAELEAVMDSACEGFRNLGKGIVPPDRYVAAVREAVDSKAVDLAEADRMWLAANIMAAEKVKTVAEKLSGDGRAMKTLYSLSEAYPGFLGL